MLRDHLATMARYDLWATTRLLDACDALTDDAYRRDTGVFFKSVHRTLNHLLLTGGLIWYVRFAEGRSPSYALDLEVEADRARLRQRLLDASRAWQPFIAGLTDERLAGRLDYQRLDGTPVSLPFAATLAHVFNHGTHHRGQVSAALTMLGRPAPELDLVPMLREEGR